MNTKITLAFSFLLISFLALPLNAQPIDYETATELTQFKITAPEKVKLNKIYQFKAHIKLLPALKNSVDLAQLKPSDITISGGMPSHGHGLPTQPIVSKITKKNSEQIDFEVSGLKFQMWGKWIVQANIIGIAEPLVINFELTP